MSDLDDAPLAELLRLYIEELRNVAEYLEFIKGDMDRLDGHWPVDRS